VAFLELWLEMTSLELWLGIADEHEELLCCRCECARCGVYEWVHLDSPPQY